MDRCPAEGANEDLYNILYCQHICIILSIPNFYVSTLIIYISIKPK